MWSADKDFIARGFSTPPPTWKSKRSSPLMPASEKKWSPQSKADLFHVLHKVPAGDSPYVRAKHVQLIDKDPSKAISLFWAAINSGDRVDSALKDMAVVMKQLDRSDEAIEAVKSFRYLCPPESQESLDNVLLELYKRSGRIEEQIEMLQVKLKQIEEGVAFGGRRTKTARSQGKKIQVTIEQEYSRLLGNLAWAYLQQENYKSAEELYRKALSIEPDKNKQCNLAICLMHMNRTTEAKFLLQTIRASSQDGHVDESYAKSFERAVKVLNDLESDSAVTPIAIEEESHLTSLSSFINRSSKGASTSVNGGQNHASNFGVSTRLRDGHEEPVLLDETNRRSRVQKQHKIYSNVVRFGKDNSEWTSLRLGNSSDSSSISSFVEKLKEWNPESQYKRTDFDSKGGKNKWFKSKTDGKQVGNSTGKKVYASLHFGREIPKVPFTQPRKSAWSNNGNPRALVDDNTVGGCSRKLSFDQSTASENVQSFTNQNLDRQLPASTDGLLEVAGQRSKTCSPSTNEDRRMLQGVHAEVNGESVLRPIVNGEWDMNYCAQKNGQMKLANIEIIPPMELAVSSGNHLTARETSTGGKWDQSFKTTIAGSVRLTERVKPVSEYMKTTQELQSQSEPTIEILEHPQEFFMSKSKKNWADMVEEDEQELLTGKFDFPENKWVYLSQDSTNSFRTPRKWSDNWDGSEFNDENMNSNIIHQTYSPADQIENISQKVESFNLEVGYYTQPQNDDVSLMNQPARRSLCFDQHQKHNRADNFCPSPLPNKTLDFEGHNALLTDDRECTSGNGVRLMRRNRLQVFQDITLFPESPRP